MKRVLIVLTALFVVMSGFAVTDAEAGLFRNRCKKSKCCEPVCCEPAPCCEATPCACEEPAPAPCGCEASAPCGCQASLCSCGMTRREARKARRAGCCVETCGCEAPCGCEASASCGCGGESAPVIYDGAAPEEAAPSAPSSDPTT